MRWTRYSKYAFRDTFRALFRHKGMALLTMLTIGITLFVLGTVSLFALNSQSASKHVEDDLEMVIFLTEGINKDQITDVEKSLDRISDIKSIKFVSKDEALRDLNKKFENKSDIKASLDGTNPLPDAYRVKVEKAEEMPAIAQKIKNISHVQDVRYGEGLVQNVVKLNHSVKIFVVAIIILMIFATLFFINSTISLTVSNRHEEIRIMNFIGATPFFIKMPFFIEGVIIGTFGSLISIAVLFYGYKKLVVYVSDNLPFVPIFDDPMIMYGLLGSLLLIGILLGAMGSAFAVKKYLKI